MKMLAIRYLKESIYSAPHASLHSGQQAWDCPAVQFRRYFRPGNSPAALRRAAAAAGRPVCSGPRANSHQLIRCSLKEPVHTHLTTLMDWPVFTFFRHLCARVMAWPNLSHLEHMSNPPSWMRSSVQVLSSLSKESSWYILQCLHKVAFPLAAVAQRADFVLGLFFLASHPLLFCIEMANSDWVKENPVDMHCPPSGQKTEWMMLPVFAWCGCWLQEFGFMQVFSWVACTVVKSNDFN